MGLTSPTVKLTKFTKVSSMADLRQLEDDPDSKHQCEDVAREIQDKSFVKNETVAQNSNSVTFTTGPHIAQMEDFSVRCDDGDAMDVVECGNSSDVEMKSEDISSHAKASEESNDEVDSSPRSSSPQAFKSGTLTRRSRRTCREQRSREHMAECMGADDGQNLDGDSTNNASSDCPDGRASLSEQDQSSHKILLDLIDGKIGPNDLPSKSRLTADRSSTDNGKGRTLDFGPLKHFGAIGPRGGIRRHSIHSGYLTLPRMTGFVGLTLPDLKTKRKNETSPLTSGMTALLDLKFFKSDTANHRVMCSSHASRITNSSPVPSRPLTISYSSRFRNSIGRRRKSITSIENLFRSLRSFSSPAPASVPEEMEHQVSATNSSAIQSSRGFRGQISTSSLRSTYSGSSTSSSCHSSPVPTPCIRRKFSLDDSSRVLMEESADVPLDVEKLLIVAETLLNSSRNTTLALLKRHLDNGCSALEDARVSTDNRPHDTSVRALASALKLHLSQFNKRLLLAKEALDDTARCYNLLDKTYEWALETMRVVNHVKTLGVASPEQVGAAAQSLAAHAQKLPPPSADTFANMVSMATKLGNTTLLQQVRMGESRCQETLSLLQSRQAALVKARRQMEFDCQSFVDLNEVLDSDDPSPFSWLVGTPLNSSGRRRSAAASTASKSRETLSRCSSLDTEDEMIFSDSTHSGVKQPLEGRTSLGGIKEVRESIEELDRDQGALGDCMPLMKPVNNPPESMDTSMSSNPHPKLSSTLNSREFNSSYMFSPIHNTNQNLNLPSLPVSMNNADSNPSRNRYLSSTDSSNSSGGSNSSCGSRGSGLISINQRVADHKSLQRASAWPYGATLDDSRLQPNDGLMEDDDEEELLEAPCCEGGGRESAGNLLLPPSSANSHLLTRSSQLDISNESFVEGDPKKNIKLCHIMSELIKTEQDYVLSLEYIIENYIPELLREDIPQALRGQRNVIFGNIEKIHEFHRGYFLKHLKQCEKKPLDIGRIFLKYERQFYLYALYNKNKPKSDDLMAEYGSQFFRKKQMEIGDKMDLASYLLKPVQRMGKYALLLTQLVQLTSGSEACHQLTEAQHMVQFQLRHGNDLLAMDSLKDCDVNLKEQGQLLRQAEFQVWEGARGRKTTRHVFLFEDLILFSKARKDPEKKNLDIFQYKHSMKMTDIGLTAQLDCSTRFEIWFRKRKPSDTYVLQAATIEVKEAWTEEISKLLWRQALRNRTLRQHEMSSMGIGNKPCLDIRPSEDQINDRSVTVACKQPARPRLESSLSADAASPPSNANISSGTSVLPRPYSIISVSSSSSSNSSSQRSSSCSGQNPPFIAGTINLGFEPGNSPRPLHRSVTRTSQCSAESGIMADMYSADADDHSHHHSLHQSLLSPSQSCYRVERSNSTVTSVSIDSGLSPASGPTSPFTLSPASCSTSSSSSSPATDPTNTATPSSSDVSVLNNEILSSLAAVSLAEQSKNNDDDDDDNNEQPEKGSHEVPSSESSDLYSSLSGTASSALAPTCEPEDCASLDENGVKTLLTTEV